MSSDSLEYLLTSSSAAQPSSACLIDVKSGNILQTYKSGAVALTNTLSQIGNDFILIAEKDKPLLHMWPVNSEQPVKNIKLILPEPAGALAISPNKHYLAVSIACKLYIWHLPSGKLLSIQQKHVLPITCVKFSANNGFLATTCKAGMLIIYRFGDLISAENYRLAQSEIGQVEPLYIHKDHTDAITSLHIGNFENESRVATVSKDRTFRLYNLITGEQLFALVGIEDGPFIMDNASWNLFLGTKSGVIFQYSFLNPPRTLTSHIDMEKNDVITFRGHEKQITCLDLNFTNQFLVSGSDDGFVILWDIRTGQQFNKIEHKGEITNVKFIMKNANLFVQNFTPDLKVQTLKRSIDQESSDYEIAIIQREDDDEDDKDDSSFVLEGVNIQQLQKHLYETKAINKQLYFALLQMENDKDTI